MVEQPLCGAALPFREAVGPLERLLAGVPSMRLCAEAALLLSVYGGRCFLKMILRSVPAV